MHRGFFAAMFFSCASTAVAQPRIGASAPEIDLRTISGKRVELSKLRGRPVVLSFWGTWCPPCHAEFPELIRVHETYAKDRLVILGINGRDQEKNIRDVQQFLRRYAVPFTVVLDKRGSARRTYRIVGQPTTVFIDAKGVVREVHTGLIDRDKLEAGIALILPRS